MPADPADPVGAAADPAPPEKPPPSGGGALDRFFDLSVRGSTVGREVRGGITTFFAMAYIIVLNPLILGGAEDINGDVLSVPQLTTMTALSAAVATVLMGLVGNVPMGLAAGLGINAVVAYQAAPQMTWPQAMGLVVLEGAVIVVLAVTGVRTLIMNAIPLALKHAIAVGIGAFVALVGLVDSGMVTSSDGSPPLSLGLGGQLATWPSVVFVVALVLMIVLYVRNVPGAILAGIVVATVIAVLVDANASVPKEGPGSWGLVSPQLPDRIVATPDFALFGEVDVLGGSVEAGVLTALVVLFTLVLSGFFDAMGTILGLSDEAGLVDERGRVPGLGRILAVDGVSAAFGGVTSSSANTVFVESAAGVGEGARTGLANVVTGALFGLTLFLTPLAAVVPSQAAAPALVLVGALMMAQVAKIDWSDLGYTVPAFLTIVVMPYTYSITNGVGVGILAFTLVKVARGKAREAGWLLWIVSVVFVLYFGLHIVEQILGVK